MSLALFPPILKTVNPSTLSALGKIVLNSAKLEMVECFNILYQASRAVAQVGFLLEKTASRFRVIICILKQYRVLRFCQPAKYIWDMLW